MSKWTWQAVLVERLWTMVEEESTKVWRILSFDDLVQANDLPVARDLGEGEQGAGLTDKWGRGDGGQSHCRSTGHGKVVPGMWGPTRQKLGTPPDRVGGCQKGD